MAQALLGHCSLDKGIIPFLSMYFIVRIFFMIYNRRKESDMEDGGAVEK